MKAGAFPGIHYLKNPESLKSRLSDLKPMDGLKDKVQPMLILSEK